MKKKRSSDLVAIKGHRNYYRSPVSGKIYYKDSKIPKFSTGETAILKAKNVVDIKRVQSSEKCSKGEAKKKVQGVVNLPVSHFFELLLAEKTPESAKATVRTYGISWKHGINGFWGKLHASDLHDQKLVEYKHWYLENHPKRSAKKTMVHFGMIVKKAFAMKAIPAMPDLTILEVVDEVVSRNAERDGVGRVYREIEEIRPMILVSSELSKHMDFSHRNKLKRATYDPKDIDTMVHLAVVLGARSGVRKMEALRLKWFDVDLVGRTFRVWATKNSTSREIPMIDELWGAFKVRSEHLGGRSPFVFPMISDMNRHTSGQFFDRFWKLVQQKAGIRGWDVKNAARYHDLRHTFATRLAEDGWNTSTACKILDMSYEIFEKVYAKPSTLVIGEQLRRTFEQTNKERQR